MLPIKKSDILNNLKNVKVFNIEPSDSSNLLFSILQLKAGVSGDITVLTVNDNQVTFKNVKTTTLINCHIKKVYATGTTADSLIGIALKSHCIKLGIDDVEYLVDQDGNFITDQDGNFIGVF